MKRFVCMLLSVSLFLCPVLTGCGNKQDNDEKSKSSAQALTPQDDDTMHLNMLFSLIATPDVGVTELLGDGTDQRYRADGSLKSRSFEGVSCGVAITFDVSYDSLGDVNSVTVQFPSSVSEEQLAATVTELTGREQRDDGNWYAETAEVSLTQEGDQWCMLLEAFTGE